MQEIARQCLAIWREMKRVQKLCLVSVLVFVATLLGFLLCRSSEGAYLPIEGHREEVVALLEHLTIPYKEGKEGALLIPKEKKEEVQHLLLRERGLHQEKGFELFDSNTWIKGDKELQVLEMRAIKGQLEKDLQTFENIKSARVILDLPPPKTFGNSPYRTKASVILTLMPGAHLSYSELRAISNHLAGAVRGLDPHMIAISDTSGKLYQGIDPEGKSLEEEKEGALVLEELKIKVEQFLQKILGSSSFFTSIERKAEGPALVVMVDEALATQARCLELETKLSALMPGGKITVDRVAFKREEASPQAKGKKGYFGLLLLIPSIAIMGLFLFYYLKES